MSKRRLELVVVLWAVAAVSGGCAEGKRPQQPTAADAAAKDAAVSDTTPRDAAARDAALAEDAAQKPDSGPQAPPTPSPLIEENMRVGIRHEQPDKQADAQVAGYSSAVSAAPGETIQLHVNVDHDQKVRWDLYRVGYYGGLGMRLVAQGDARPVTVQPECPTDPRTGMIECDWAAAFAVTIEQDWVSGFYVFELVNEDGYGSRVPFVIKEGMRRAAALAQASVTTWQAYNKWGGTSIYINYNKQTGPYKGNSGRRVSFNRPYLYQNEFPSFLCLVRFLEQRGYDLSYTTNLDVDADPSVVLKRKLFLMLAHDEYWTVTQRDAIDAARDQGVSLANLSANTGYWRIRLESDGKDVPRRRMTTYKNANADPVKDSPDTTEMFSRPPYARPENALLGVGWRTWSKVPGYPYIVTNADHWVYEGTGVKNYEALSCVVGAEWDGIQDNGMSPAGLEMLARAITIDNDGYFIEGEANATVYYPTPSSLVFAAGSIYWGYGLGDGPFADARVERMTENVIARAGVPANTPLTEPKIVRAPTEPFVAKVLAGSGGTDQADGAARSASFKAPTGMAAGTDGKLYIVDRGDQVIRVLSPDGQVSSMVYYDNAVFRRPLGLAADSHGVLYLSDTVMNRIFKLTPDGKITPFAGTGKAGSDDDSDPLQASFNAPRGLAVGPNDELYVADNMNNAVRRIDATGVTTLANALGLVSSVAAGPDGAVYFSTIARGQIGVVKGGQVSILANVAGKPGNLEGPAEEARLQPGEGMLFVTDAKGDRLLFADTENNRVRALSLKDKTVTTVYGDGNATPDPLDAQHTWLPRGLVAWNGGYAVSDFGSRRILWFAPLKPQ